MLSTLLNYRLYAGDMTRTLARVGEGASVEREARYYRENIAGIRTVDEFLADRRLTAYALRAHGLSDQIGSQALIRKVLESDLTDPASFANRLSDQRFRAFAATFDFASGRSNGTVQSQAQTDRLVEAYSLHLVRGGAIAAEKAAHFEKSIANVRSVDELLADPVMREMVAKIAGVDPDTVSRDFMRGLLSNAAEPSATLSAGQRFLATAFGFRDGVVPAGGSAQSATQTSQFLTRYFAAAGQGASSQSAGFEERYFERAAPLLRSVEELLADPTLTKVVRLATGFPDSEQGRSAIVNLLSLAADHKDNPIARLDPAVPAQAAQRDRLLAVKAAFRFENGAVPDGGSAVDPAALAPMLREFHAAYPKTAEADITLRINSFRVQLSTMDSVNDLLSRDPVYGRAAFEFVLKAFDIDPAHESTAKIRRVLTSDPSDPSSFVRRLGDERYERLATAFNFSSDGTVRAERLVQSVRAQQDTATRYAASFGDNRSEAERTRVRADTVRYLSAVGGVQSLDALLANREVLDYALKAHGLADARASMNDLRQLLTSDPLDPRSFARTFQGGRFAEFAESFRFSSDGTVRPVDGGVQDSAALRKTENLFLLQMLEEEAGATSEGTRLALYFLRKAPEARSAMAILGDRALFEVVRTALGLPASMTQLDIDRQAEMIERRLDVADFTDPAKLDRFIMRFSALHDMNNPPSGASSPVLALFGGAGTGTAPGLVGLF